MSVNGLHWYAHKHACVPTQICPAHMHTAHTYINKTMHQQLSLLQEILKSIRRNYERQCILGCVPNVMQCKFN